MIRHIVMWTLKEHASGATRAENTERMKALLESCRGCVAGMLRFEVALAQPGRDCTADVVLNSEFESPAALDAYLQHPTHLAIKPFISAVRDTRHCMDYDV